MIAIAQMLGAKMKKPACLGLALFNSSLKSFFVRQD
jgi:hypothetical protein